MSTDKIKITVDDNEIEVVAGSMLIEVADEIGITIPRFCYHEKLSISANCRMCLVEVDKAPKVMPACATPVNEGMVVWTRSEKALQAQKDTMEFLLINHPLDCPICDQGGECELQDLSMATGGCSSNFNEIKRVVPDKDVGELVATEMTRCIQCTRCIRFGDEIAGMREIGAMGRGDRMSVGTYIEKHLSSELSGNIIDICPVGALTAKPSRYTCRPWEMAQSSSVASHDCVGSNIKLHTFKNKLVRVVADDNDAINECWISDRDRFSYQGIYSEDRSLNPKIKTDGLWREVSWGDALEKVASTLKAVKPDDIGVLASPRATIEELYLLQKSMRGIGVNNIDHRHRQTDFHAQETMGLFPWLGMSLTDVEQQNALLLIGSDVRKEQPMLNHRIRKAVINNDAAVMAVNSQTLEYNYAVQTQLVSSPSDMVDSLLFVAKACLEDSQQDVPVGLSDLLNAATLNDSAKEIANTLKEASDSVVLLGSTSVQYPNYSTMRALAVLIAESTGAQIAYLSEASNTVGAWLSGAIPHRAEAGKTVDATGKNSAEMLTDSLNTYVLLDVEPSFDFDNACLAQRTMKDADCVIAITPYASAGLLECADVILPSAAFGETSGSYVNAEGVWQSVRAVAKGPVESRPAWKILRVLGNKLGVQGFDYVSSSDVMNELKQCCDDANPVSNTFEFASTYTHVENKIDSAGSFQRIGSVAEFCGDSMQRRATALQKSAPEQNTVQLNASSIEKVGLTESLEESQTVTVEQDDCSVQVSLLENNAVPDGCALLCSGTLASSSLGSAFGSLKITC